MIIPGWVVLIPMVIGIVVAVRLGIYYKYKEYYTDMINEARKGELPIASLSFDEFLKFYNLNPDKWGITYIDNIKYNYKAHDKTAYRIVFNKYSDYRKFREWTTNKKLREREEKELTSNLAFCDQLKKDIQAMQEESHKQIHEAKERGMDLIQQCLANERAKKEKEKKKNDFGSLDSTCWPTWVSNEEVITAKPEVGKIYRRVNGEQVEYGFMKYDGKICWAISNGVKTLLASFFGKYNTIYDVPGAELDWNILLKEEKDIHKIEDGLYKRWNAKKGRYEQGFQLANGEICWVGCKIIKNPLYEGMEHVSGNIYKRWNAEHKSPEYGFKNKDGSFIWAYDVAEG